MAKLGKSLASFIALAALAVTTPSFAIAVVDQDFVSMDDPDNGTGLGIVSTSLAQTFEVGLSGVLTGIEFNILKFSATTGDLTVDIRELDGLGPNPFSFTALASETVSNSDIGIYGGSPYAWSTIYVDFSAENLMVSAGDSLAFVLSSPIGESFGIQTDYLNSYSGGSRWSQAGDGSAFNELNFADLAFKTYVEQVPAPAALILFGIGLVGLLGFRRKNS